MIAVLGWKTPLWLKTVCVCFFFPQPPSNARPTKNRVAKQTASSRLPAVTLYTLPWFIFVWIWIMLLLSEMMRCLIAILCQSGNSFLISSKEHSAKASSKAFAQQLTLIPRRLHSRVAQAKPSMPKDTLQTAKQQSMLLQNCNLNTSKPRAAQCAWSYSTSTSTVLDLTVVS